MLRTERGEVTKGSIELDDRRIDGMRAHDVTRLGIVQVFEGRRVFENLTTEENLIAGGHVQRDGGAVRQGIERVYAYFPQLQGAARTSSRATCRAASSRCWRSAAR